ncbi:cap-specific mRNA (nucleoside-2'-O-)-methyltransferase 2-like [Lasioglossum baleicum]|uniref:cap-specific mRNA (nucleoside-2'-O-)-methyltransferase 2-like n=1 Tax=Lasioglossum baleicum TaxID=434251 RepID=UPI003FCC55C9
METDKPVTVKEQLSSTNFTDLKIVDTVERVNNLFNKRFSIKHNECYCLPDPQTMFTCPVWNVDELQKLKHELNDIKSSLNNYNMEQWHSHTTDRNSAKYVMTYLKKQVKPEFLTQAWCKFYEIVSSFPLIPIGHINNNNGYFKSVHLCEAPGAFVTSLNHWLKTNTPEIQWDWIATTLNPYYEGYSTSEMISDDRFIRHTFDRWCFGKDNTGNLKNLENLNELIKASEPRDNIFLVTADGSIDCTGDPGEQENIVAHLHFCEATAALHFLQTGGSLVLKIFTTFECHSICLLYLLCCCFNEVNVVKPATSKEGNSETYVVCTNFKGRSVVLPHLKELMKYYECSPEKAMFNKDDIPCAFILKIVECSKFFKYHQSLVIMNNVITFDYNSPKICNYIKRIQHMVGEKYIADYNIRKLMSGDIVGNTTLTTTNNVRIRRMVLGSYNERCERHHLAPWDQLEALYDDLNRLEITEYPSDQTLTFTVNELPGGLQISLAKAFHRVYSSRFCSDSIFVIKTKIDDILANMGHSIQYPPMKKVNKLKKKILCRPMHKILTFQFTNVYDTYKMINTIYDTIQSLDMGDTLVLVGYPLLTSFNVGLLYLISCTFNSVALQLRNGIGSEITLEYYNNSEEILKHLGDVKATSSNIQGTGSAILQIFPATFLYESDLFFPVVSSNHWTIKSYVHYIFTTLEKHIKEEGN